MCFAVKVKICAYCLNEAIFREAVGCRVKIINSWLAQTIGYWTQLLVIIYYLLFTLQSTASLNYWLP